MRPLPAPAAVYNPGSEVLEIISLKIHALLEPDAKAFHCPRCGARSLLPEVGEGVSHLEAKCQHCRVTLVLKVRYSEATHTEF